MVLEKAGLLGDLNLEWLALVESPAWWEDMVGTVDIGSLI